MQAVHAVTGKLVDLSLQKIDGEKVTGHVYHATAPLERRFFRLQGRSRARQKKDDEREQKAFYSHNRIFKVWKAQKYAFFSIFAKT